MALTKAERVIRAAESAAWAIEPSKLEAITELLDLRAAGETFSEEEVRDRIAAAERPRERRGGGVAVLPLFGVIAHRMGSFHDVSGGTSTERFIARLDELLADESIGTIVLDVNSPGGTVYGVPEAAERLFEARSEKRIIAVSNALMASAAYWIGSAADEVVITPSGEIGSIGVYTIHTEISELEKNVGVKRTIISAGRFKAEGSPYEKLSKEAREHIAEAVGDYYELFTESVARHMGAKVGEVRQGFGEGRALTAKRAVAAGIAHRIGTLGSVLRDLGVRTSHARAARADVDEQLERAAEADTPLELVAIDAGRAVPGAVVTIETDAFDAACPASLQVVDRNVIVHAQEEGQEPADDAGDEDEPEDEGAGSDAPRKENDDEPREDATGGATREKDPPPPETAPAAKENTVDKDTAARTGAGDGGSGQALATVGHDPSENGAKRAADIAELCALHGLADKAGEFIRSGKSTDRVGREILELKEKDRPGSTLPNAKPAVELTDKENRQYSVTRFMLAAVNGRPEAAGFEWEVHQELQKQLSYSPKGIMIPTTLGSLPRSEFRTAYSRAELERLGYQGQLTTDTTGGGEELVFIEPGSFIELLRSRLVAAQMGATFLPGLRGNVDFPKQTGAGEFSWVNESSVADEPSDSDLDTGIVSLRPKNGRSITSFSRTLLAQAVVNVEQLVRADLAAITARGLDRAALHGSGQGNEPTGIYTATGVHPINFAAINDLYKAVVAMETAIAEADADIERMGYVTTPGSRGQFKTTLNFAAAAAGQPIWTGGVRDGEMNGFRAMASTQVLRTLGSGNNEHGIVFGAWQHLLIGEWGAMDVLVDPYTRGGRGLIRVIAFAIADVALRYAEAFAKGTGHTVAPIGS